MTSSITAAVLNSAPGTLDVERVTLAHPNSREVLVRVAYAGLCHSDLHEMDGTFATTPPILLGHEASGVVEAIGDEVTDINVGDHVVTCLSVFCGSCKYCISGRLTLCINRTRLALGSTDRLRNAAGATIRPTAGIGAFAEKIVVHRNALAVLPTDMPLAPASILGCALVTGMGAVLHRARVKAGTSVVVIGTGGVGMSAIQAAVIAGASHVVAVDVVPEKLEAAKRFGATDVINGRQTDPVAAVREITRGGADYSFEAVGHASITEQAVAMLAAGGTATVIGMVPPDPPIRVDGADLFLSEKRLQGSFMGSNHFPTDIASYVQFYRQGRLLLDDMISDQVTLTNINDGFSALASGTSMRVIAEIGPQ